MNKKLVSFWSLPVEERKEIAQNMFPVKPGVKIGMFTIEQEDRTIEVPRLCSAQQYGGDESIVPVCMGDTSKPNANGIVYGGAILDALRKRLSQGNLYGEYGSPSKEVVALPDDEKFQRVSTVDLEKVSHEVMGADEVDGKVYIYLRIINTHHGNHLVGAEKPSFGIRGTCRVSRPEQPVQEFKSIVSIDYIGDNHDRTS